MKEQWKPIADFVAYEVSNMGRVRRRLKGGHNTRVGTFMPPRPVKNGYFQVQLFSEGKRCFLSLHRLIAQAFVPNLSNLPEVHHKRGKSNRASNLEWRSKDGHIREHVKRRQAQGEGVTFLKRSKKKWRASYFPEPRKRVYLGMFATRREAINARRAAIEKLPNFL